MNFSAYFPKKQYDTDFATFDEDAFGNRVEFYRTSDKEENFIFSVSVKHLSMSEINNFSLEKLANKYYINFIKDDVSTSFKKLGLFNGYKAYRLIQHTIDDALLTATVFLSGNDLYTIMTMSEGGNETFATDFYENNFQVIKGAAN